jgi:hypothetical protein
MSGTRVKRSADYIEGALEFSFIFHSAPKFDLKRGPMALPATPDIAAGRTVLGSPSAKAYTVNQSEVCPVMQAAATAPLQLNGVRS